MPPSLSSEGNRLLAAGMIPEAIASFENALKSDPNDARCLLGLSKAHRATGDDNAALASLDKLLTIKPDHLEAKSHRGFILAKRGDAQGAAEMDAASKDRRAGFEEHFNYGTYLLSAKKDDLAQREFEACIRIESRDPRPYVELGNIAMRQKNQAAANNHFLKATQFAGPKDAAPFVALARAYRDSKQGAQAATTYQQALQRRPEDDALHEEAYLALVGAGEFDSALKIVLLARQRKPDEPKFSKWQEEVMAKLKSAPKKAAGGPVAFEAGDQSSVDVDKELAKASDLLLRNPPTPPHIAKQVMAIADTVLRVQPDNSDAMIKIAICKYLFGEWDACEEMGKKALAAAVAKNNKIWKTNAELLLQRLTEKRKEKGIKPGAAPPKPGAAPPKPGAAAAAPKAKGK
ncbi:MAG TPA: tetratricopeptide repeat protein [Myxococcaceae bacterium]